MKKIIFLHIPKTAGQSVHHFFQTAFPNDEIFPGRVNQQLKDYSCEEMNNYKIFSGHLDWEAMECLEGPKFTFSILRDPIERIYSFYFFLRKQAEKLTIDQLNLPEHTGMKAALTLSPDDYFCNKDTNFRTFIDNHYNNFYTFYFAGKTYDSRQKIVPKIGIGKIFSSMEDVLELAIENMNTLDKVYDINNWKDLFGDIKSFMPMLETPNDTYHVNKGDGLNLTDREEELKNLGATEKTFNAIDDFCTYDKILYEKFCK